VSPGIRPSSWIHQHQCFRWTCCSHLQVSRLLWNTDTYPLNQTYQIPQECKIPVFCDTGWEVPNILKAHVFLVMALDCDPLRYRHYNTMKHYKCLPKNSVICQKNGIFSKTTVRSWTSGCYLAAQCNYLNSYKYTCTAGSHSGTGKVILTRIRICNFHHCTPKLMSVCYAVGIRTRNSVSWLNGYYYEGYLLSMRDHRTVSTYTACAGQLAIITLNLRL
jgi:hypothetical protein